MEKEFPECPICLDLYGNSQTHIRTPKVLKCGDCFCKECLKDIITKNENNFFECPICKRQIRKEIDIDEYITNKELIRIINSSFNLVEKEVENKEVIKIKPIQYSIIFLGSSEVGKTSIFQRIATDKFDDNYQPSIGIDLFVYYVKYKNKKYKLIFYDTAGAEKHKAITKLYLKNADGVLFVYSLSDESSFNELEMWYDFYKEEKKKVVGVLIGNKSDINNEEREVNFEKAEKFAKEHELKYFETSAKNDKYIKKAIVSLLKKIIESKNLYDSLDSIDSAETNNKAFQLIPMKLKKENFCERFCKNLNPKNWFK